MRDDAVLMVLRCAASLSACLLLLIAAAGAAEYPSFYPADARTGKVLSASCVACHGTPGLAMGKPAIHVPKLGGQRASSIFDALLEYNNGARRSSIMRPIAAALSEQDMRNVALFVSGEDLKPSRDAIPSSPAAKRVHEDCAACHGETGLGIMPGYPVIGGQYADYLALALREFKNGKRRNPTMNIMARKLSDAQIRQLAEYFQARGYLRDAP